MHSKIQILVFVCLSFAGLSFLNGTLVSAQESKREKVEFFESKIRPVLIEHCYECHSSKSNNVQGGLKVDSRASIRAGGDSDAGVVPGKTDEGTLLDALNYESFEMPPSGKLPESVIADFEKWITDGAIDPRESAANSAAAEIDLEKGKKFWAFQPTLSPEIPTTQDNDWPQTSVDHFVLAELESRELKPVPDASREELVRRLYFDLIGLPPSPDELAAFLADRSEDRLEQLVDGLLARPQFGERWARHWLDVARYSDSSGGGRVLIFHDAWQYRDYVINAMNNDKPYDQFVREQLAGDLLPFENHLDRSEKLTATGFLVLGPHNYELQDKELLRMEIVDEQIDVIGRSMMGMTLGCVRCHDHKFDPIPVEDYYALAGIFRSTDSVVNANVSRFVETKLPLPPDQQAELEKHIAESNRMKQELETAAQELAAIQKANPVSGTVAVSELEGIVLDDSQATLKGNWATGTLKPFVGQNYRYASDQGAAATFETELPKSGSFEVLVSYTAHPNRGSQVPVVVSVGSEEVLQTQVNQQVTPSIGGLFQSIGTIQVPEDHNVSVSIRTTTGGCSIIDSVQFLTSDQKKHAGSSHELDEAVLAEIESQKRLVAELEQRLKSHQQTTPAQHSVMSVRDHSEKGDYFVCIRGDAHQLGNAVKRHGLSVLPEFDFAINQKNSGRLEFVNWLTDPGHPLTARVYVNRIWLHLFGDGLVRTPDNFGAMGELPSNPDLLDHLAEEFVDHGWSTKTLIRMLVLSRVYALSSKPSESALKLDPENRLWSHANRRRLDAESIRDAILCLSGNLDSRSLGPSINRDLKREFGYEYKSLRRTVYLPIFRNTLHDMLDVFDFPNPNIVGGKRNTSTLPTQALYLMNSSFVVEQSAAAAKRVINEFDDNSARLDFAYSLALGRTPTDQERSTMNAYLNAAGTSQADIEEAWGEICLTLISSLDFRFIK